MQLCSYPDLDDTILNDSHENWISIHTKVFISRCGKSIRVSGYMFNDGDYISALTSRTVRFTAHADIIMK